MSYLNREITGGHDGSLVDAKDKVGDGICGHKGVEDEAHLAIGESKGNRFYALRRCRDEALTAINNNIR